MKILHPLFAAAFSISSVLASAQEHTYVIPEGDIVTDGRHAVLHTLVELNPDCAVIPDSFFDQLAPTASEPVSDRKWGSTFPINPEFLVPLLKKSPQSVVEIAGAKGDNAILFLLAGTQSVSFNDLLPDQVDYFEFIVNTLQKKIPLPSFSTIEDRAHVHTGDCFDFLRTLRDSSTDLLIARSIAHFFTASKMDELFAEANRILTPGGKLFLTVNDRDIFGSPEFAADPNLKATVTERIYVIHTDPPETVKKEYLAFEPTHEEEDQHTATEISVRPNGEPTGMGETLSEDELSSVRSTMAQLEAKYQKGIFVASRKTTASFFTNTLLRDVVDSHGLTVNMLMKIDDKGLAYQSENPDAPYYRDPSMVTPQSIGVIATKP